MEYEGLLQMRLIVSCPTPHTNARDANWSTAKASKAARTQALDHQNPDTFKKYQSKVKQLDLGACFWNEEPDHESHAIEESMIHHRDPNVPQKLDAATVVEVENDPRMMGVYQQVDILNRKIAGDPDKHEDLVAERAKLYNKAAKLRRAKKGEFIKNWWKSSYDEYILGNEFTERDTTDVFDICRKYMPERARLRENLFQEVPIHSELGRQCLHDMLNLIKSEERVAYYPGESPVDGKCPLCSKEMARFVIHVPDIFLELTVAASISNVAQNMSCNAEENHSTPRHISRGIRMAKELIDGSIPLFSSGAIYVLSGSIPLKNGKRTVNPISLLYSHVVDF
jgi:hypothetical protein